MESKIIKTPVTLGHRHNCIIDADGNIIAYDVDYNDGGKEIVERINLHDELVEALKNSKYALKQQYGNDSDFINKIYKLLDKCK